MNKLYKVLASTVLAAGLAVSGAASAGKMAVGITPGEASVTVKHNGKDVNIMRNQNQKNTVKPSFAKTSRKCPPFCIQPSIHYAKKMSEGDDSIIVVDSRTPDWVAKGTIPSAKNIPWTKLNPAKGADPISIGEIMEEEFGAKQQEGLWDFSNVKTAVMFCNGMWCGQSPNNIQNLLKFGYPAHKIKWYRGGMQDWEILGLTTVKP